MTQRDRGVHPSRAKALLDLVPVLSPAVRALPEVVGLGEFGVVLASLAGSTHVGKYWKIPLD